MLKTDFNQPKGSTIGVLKDGSTVQQAFDTLGYTGGFLGEASVRAVRPTTNGQRIMANVQGVLSQWVYDAEDTVTADNGWFCLVTPEGHRWIREDGMFGIDISKGFVQGTDLSTKWQQAVDYSVYMAVTRKKTLRSATPIQLPTGECKMTKTVRCPSWIGNFVDGALSVDLSELPDNEVAFWCKGVQVNGLSTQGATTDVLSASNGIKFNGKGRDFGQIAIKVGNTATEWTNQGFNNGGSRFYGVVTWNCHTSVFLTNYNMYLAKFANFDFGIGQYGVVFGTYGEVSMPERDSGERIEFNGGVIYGMRYGIRFGMNAAFVDISNVSFDYTTYDVLSFANNTIYNMITLSKVHVEATGGWMIAGGNANSNNVINLDRVDNLTTLVGGAQVTETESNSLCRQMFNLNGGFTINCHMFGQLSPAQQPHNPKIWLNAGTAARIRQSNPSPMAAVPRPGSPADFLAAYTFNDSPLGTTIDNITTFTLTESVNVVKADSIVVDVGNGQRGIKIVTNTVGASGAYAVALTTPKFPVVGNSNYAAMLAYQPLLTGTAGSYIYTWTWYDLNGNVISTENYTGSVTAQRSDKAIIGYVEPGVVEDKRFLPVYAATRMAPANAATATITYRMAQTVGVFNIVNLYAWRTY
nr:tail spike protein [Klebsiella phage vB_Kpn_K82P1]